MVDAAAYDLAITGHESLIGPDHFEGDLEKVDPGEAVTFMAALVLSTSDSTITVHWSDEPAVATGRCGSTRCPRVRGAEA